MLRVVGTGNMGSSMPIWDRDVALLTLIEEIER